MIFRKKPVDVILNDVNVDFCSDGANVILRVSGDQSKVKSFISAVSSLNVSGMKTEVVEIGFLPDEPVGYIADLRISSLANHAVNPSPGGQSMTPPPG